jgi:hypothetical protein
VLRPLLAADQAGHPALYFHGFAQTLTEDDEVELHLGVDRNPPWRLHEHATPRQVLGIAPQTAFIPDNSDLRGELETLGLSPFISG